MVRFAAVICCLLVVPATASAQDSGLLAPLVAPTPKKKHRRHHRARHHRKDAEAPAPGSSGLLAPLVKPSTLAVSVAGGLSGAEVQVDGADWGIAPIGARKVDAGLHRVVIHRRGYADLSREVKVNRGQHEQLELSMVPVSAVVALGSRPSGALVQVDGKVVGTTPMDGLVLSPGVHVLRAETTDRGSKPMTVAVRAGHDYRFTLQLSEARTDGAPLAPVETPEHPAVAALEHQVPAVTHTSTPWYGRWYIWAGVGVLAAAATVAVVEETGSSPKPLDPSAVCGGACAGTLQP